MSIPANLAAAAFAGTAEDYARFRPPYPPALLDDLSAAAPGRGLALDLACGPGRIALDLGKRFEAVWAIDLEPDMVAMGRREAGRRDITNLAWFAGPAEALDAPKAAFDLITVGEAFHRLDQTAVLDQVRRWLRPGGVFATMGSRGLLNGVEPWQRIVAAVAAPWMDRAFPGGWGIGAPAGPDHETRLFQAVGLTDVAVRSYDLPWLWSFEAIMGYLRSTSVCSARALGVGYPAFEAELRAALGVRDDSQTFTETLNFGFTAGRNP